MRIATVMPLAEQRGGGELMLLHLMQQGRGVGVDWLVVFLQDGPMVAQVRQLGVETRVIHSGRLRTSGVTWDCRNTGRLSASSGGSSDGRGCTS